MPPDSSLVPSPLHLVFKAQPSLRAENWDLRVAKHGLESWV